MKILIVDDEPLIHVSIEYSLKELDIQDLQIFHAYNGTEMLRLMEENPADLALVDIRMPGTDGLSAIEECRKHWPLTAYYIMSGFSEFEYARKAVHLEVEDYLLKPLDPGQLAEIISKVRERMTEREEQLISAFHAWLVGTLHRHDVSSLFDSSYYAVLMLLCNDSPHYSERTEFPEVLSAISAPLLSVPCWEGALWLAFDQDESTLRKAVHTLPGKGYPEGVTCFVSQVSNDPMMLGKSMHRILDGSPVRVFNGAGRLYQPAQLNVCPESDMTSGMDWIELRNYYREKRSTEFLAAVPRLISTLEKRTEFQREQLTGFIHAFTGLSVPAPFGLDEIRGCLERAGEDLLHSETGTNRIDAVIEYVQENYRKDISIAGISAKFDISPNYLSTLFKKKLGVNFVDYLSSLRLAEAKRLLLGSDQSIREISESVGYYSQSHFTKIFMKKEGCTPGEYRTRKKKD